MVKTVKTRIGPARVPLTGYLHEYSPEMEMFAARPAVVVCPGGGYVFRSDRETDPVALRFCAAGYQTFVLRYSTAEEAGTPLGIKPLTDLSCAVAAVRSSAREWGVDPEKIAVCGFSAGGHLAASLGVHWDSPRLRAAALFKRGENRPNALVLCYPVISAGEYAHRGSIKNLAGENAEDAAFFSLENHIDGDRTPPAFLWHTVEDDAVSVENALLFASGLRRAGVPFEMHLYESGGHGMSVCTREVGAPDRHNADWMRQCLEWLGRRFSFEEFT